MHMHEDPVWHRVGVGPFTGLALLGTIVGLGGVWKHLQGAQPLYAMLKVSDGGLGRTEGLMVGWADNWHYLASYVEAPLWWGVEYLRETTLVRYA